MGKNIKKLRDVTFDQCATACDKNKKCKGIEYFKKSGARMTSSSYREGDCLLNSGTNIYTPECDASLYQMYFWEKSEMQCSKNNIC